MKKELIIVAIVLLIVIFVLNKKKDSESEEDSGSGRTGAYKPPTGGAKIQGMETTKNLTGLVKAMKNWGITSKASQIGILATIGKESNFIPKFEKGYATTSNERIRKIFPTKTKGVSDSKLTSLKADDKKFFNFIYDDILGNRPGTDDGYNYRGSGYNQLTGRGNYEKYASKSGIDILSNPALNNNPDVAAQTALHFFYEGWDSAEGKKRLKDAGYNYINDIEDIDFAVRFFCNINTGLGNAMNSAKVDSAVSRAYPYAVTLKDLLQKY